MGGNGEKGGQRDGVGKEVGRVGVGGDGELA